MLMLDVVCEEIKAEYLLMSENKVVDLVAINLQCFIESFAV